VREWPPPPENFLTLFMPSRVRGQFGPENKLIEGQPNEYDVICLNASVLAFHVWPTIFAGAPFRLQNICRRSTAFPHHYTPANRSWHRPNDRMGRSFYCASGPVINTLETLVALLFVWGYEIAILPTLKVCKL